MTTELPATTLVALGILAVIARARSSTAVAAACVVAGSLFRLQSFVFVPVIAIVIAALKQTGERRLPLAPGFSCT